MQRTLTLKTILQVYLGTDDSAVKHLPFVLALINEDVFESSYLKKWSMRVSSLIHARNTAAKWAGACLALHTAKSSRTLMLSAAPGWVVACIPIISRTESIALQKAAIKLVTYICTATADVLDFQRQVVAGNMSTIVSALSSVVKQATDPALLCLALDALSSLISTVSTLPHTAQSALLGIRSVVLEKPLPKPLSNRILNSTAYLHSVLPMIGGKVGAINLWRRNLDEVISFCWAAYHSLRSSYTENMQFPNHDGDPVIQIPANLDRLRCGIRILTFSLRVRISRPVAVPIASLVKLCTVLIDCHIGKDQMEIVDPNVQGLEEGVAPDMHTLGCELLISMSESLQTRLYPHATQLLKAIARQLEQAMPMSRRLTFVASLRSLVTCFPCPNNSALAGRVIKSLLRSLTVLLPEESGFLTGEQQVEGFDLATARKGKKRQRDLDLSTDSQMIVERGSPSALHETPLALTTLDVLPHLLRTPSLPQHLLAVSARILVGLYIGVKELSVTGLSLGQPAQSVILHKIRATFIDLLPDTTSVLSNVMPVILRSVIQDSTTNAELLPLIASNQRALERLVHPRLPPLKSMIPQLNVLLLLRNGQSEQEKELLDSFSLRIANSPSVRQEVHSDLARSGGDDIQEMITPSSGIRLDEDIEMVQAIKPPDNAPNDARSTMIAMNEAEMQIMTPAGSEPPLSILQPPDNKTIAELQSAGATQTCETTYSANTVEPQRHTVHHYEGQEIAHKANISPTQAAPHVDDSDDEEIPSIDMASDTDSEEDQ